MVRKKTEKKYIFSLKNINKEQVETRYSISLSSNINNNQDVTPDNTTQISELGSGKQNHEVISFLNETKKSHKCTVSMIDFNTSNEVINNNYSCFWCKSSIPQNVLAIGCPIKYIPSYAIKSYYSEISKDTYTIKEKITKIRQDKIENESKNSKKISISDRNYYLTDGIFCSFNCCMAFISDNKYNSLYKLSTMLLLKMYNDIYKQKIISIEEAPHWRTLQKFGGNLSIEKFRDSFNKIEYMNHGSIVRFPKFQSTGTLFEEKLKF